MVFLPAGIGVALCRVVKEAAMGAVMEDRMLLALAAIGFLYVLRLVYLVVPWFYSYFLRPAKPLSRLSSSPLASLDDEAQRAYIAFLHCLCTISVDTSSSSYALLIDMTRAQYSGAGDLHSFLLLVDAISYVSILLCALLVALVKEGLNILCFPLVEPAFANWFRVEMLIFCILLVSSVCLASNNFSMSSADMVSGH